MGREEENTIIDEVKKITLKDVANEDVRVYLFGSWAKGLQKRTSDIDIAIEYKDKSQKYLITKLRTAFEESNIPYRVEVVDLISADEHFRKIVKEEGIIWKDFASASL